MRCHGNQTFTHSQNMSIFRTLFSHLGSYEDFDTTRKCPGGGWVHGSLFVFVALRPMSTAMVIAGRSVHLTTLFLGRLEQAVNQ